MYLDPGPGNPQMDTVSILSVDCIANIKCLCPVCDRAPSATCSSLVHPVYQQVCVCTAQSGDVECLQDGG